MSVPPPTGGRAAGVVTVWWAHRSMASALDDAVLSDLERRRVARLRAVADRERSAVARGVLRLALAQLIPDAAGDLLIDWERGPMLPSSLGLWASVSHSDDGVAVAVSDVGPVGVDIEAVRRVAHLVPAVQQSVFTEQERATLAATPALQRPTGALRLWTLKEAVLKATGDGLVRAPATLQIVAAPGGHCVDHFDGRDDLVDATRLFTFDPEISPVHAAGSRASTDPSSSGGSTDDRTGPDASAGAVPAYLASLAVLTAGDVEVVERSAVDLLQPA